LSTSKDMIETERKPIKKLNPIVFKRKRPSTITPLKAQK